MGGLRKYQSLTDLHASLPSHWPEAWTGTYLHCGRQQSPRSEGRHPLHYLRLFLKKMCSVASVVSDSLQPLDCSLPDSSVHGISQARILEWVAMPSSGGPSPPRDQICLSSISCIAGAFFTTRITGEDHLKKIIPNKSQSIPFFMTCAETRETMGNCLQTI